MKNIIILLLGLLIAIVVACNVAVIGISRGHCFSSVETIPHSQYGILLGTGRSSASSPYYDARIQATIALWNTHKVDTIIISGENLYADYNEVDSMAVALHIAIPDAPLVLDYHGTDTQTSLQTAGEMFGYGSSYTIISQHFHNQRAVVYGSLLFDNTPNAMDAVDTDMMWWRIRNVIREWGARVKAVLFML